MRRASAVEIEAGKASHCDAVIAFVSGKGGVGKTNIAVNVTVEFARGGRRPILLDADFGLANADLLLDADGSADLSDLLDERRQVSECLTAVAGFRMVCGVSAARDGPRQRWRPGQAHRVLERLRGFSDTIVVDCGAGLGEEVLSFARAAGTVVVVATPEPPALVDAYATIKTLHLMRYGGRLGVVINLAAGHAEAARAARRLCDTSRRFLGRELACFGWIPQDRGVPRAVAARRPVMLHSPRCPAAQRIADLAEAIRPRPPAALRWPLWRRFTDLFA